MNLLFSKLNFDEPWAYGSLREFLRGGCRVTVLPFSFWDSEVYSEESWNAVYRPGGKYFQEITRAFSAYGILPEAFTFISYFSDDADTFAQALRESDILFLTGGAPELTMKRIREKGFAEPIKAYKGMIMGCSAGAMVQCGCFHITPNRLYPTFYHAKGLGLLPAGYGVEVHYVKDAHHMAYVERTVSETGRQILLLDNQSGAVFRDGQWKLLGNARFYIREEETL